ncbi:MAG: 4'-phosphopantetheinyl transferase superfamily protein [Anaerolineales bacterium]|nr:4'-phosphopantetheinyl transferase superfamily protein [Anaerolineales bacterium]MCB8937762.1 4'-phosphopantetheinyl transferase superfamily protein [Ardenticatenaceae bacterium]
MIHWLTQSHETMPRTAVSPHKSTFLSDSEADRLATLTTEKRRRDWLLGRWTAKRLLQTVIWETSHTTVPLDLITVANNADGVPTIASQLPLVDGQYSISLSHSHGQALVTAVAKPNWPIGCDIEKVAPRGEAFIDDYFTETEALLVRQVAGAQRDLLTTAVWSAKESVLKALHLGLSVDTRAVACLIDPVERPSDSWMPFKVWCDNGRLPHPAPHFSGWWRVMDGFVLTLVVEQ